MGFSALTLGLSALAVLSCLTAAGVWWFRRRRRARQARLLVLAELEELGVDRVRGQRVHRATGAPGRDLGTARVLYTPQGLARKGTTFLVQPETLAGWPKSPLAAVVVRFECHGTRHELCCRVLGRARRWRRRAGDAAPGATILRLAPDGVVARRERRDMMRFFVDAADGRSPRGTVDARRFVELTAWVRQTDLVLGDGVILPSHLAMEEVVRTPDAGTGADSPSVPPAAAGADPDGLHLYLGGSDAEDGIPVDVLDFSGTGLQVEADLSALTCWLRLGPEEAAGDVLHRLADRALLVTVRMVLDFPHQVQELIPEVPPRTWVLASVARDSLIEEDEGPRRVRLGLAFLYQIAQIDEATGRPRQWERLTDLGEAKDFVALHAALNRAMAQIQSDATV